jgi:hypothetical protein
MLLDRGSLPHRSEGERRRLCLRTVRMTVVGDRLKMNQASVSRVRWRTVSFSIESIRPGLVAIAITVIVEIVFTLQQQKTSREKRVTNQN